MCCCPSRSCCLCLLFILIILLVGFVFGFGIFAHGFHKIKDWVHDDVDSSSAKRPFFAPPPQYR